MPKIKGEASVSQRTKTNKGALKLPQEGFNPSIVPTYLCIINVVSLRRFLQPMALTPRRQSLTVHIHQQIQIHSNPSPARQKKLQRTKYSTTQMDHYFKLKSDSEDYK